jgi:aryl-alcohol dehydrogenase-like predicted oxidoreductase
MAPPAPIFGGASIGDSYKTVSEVTVLSDIIKHAGIRQIDTAARYANTQSETLIGGAILPAIFDIDTKIWVETADGSGTLTTAAIEKSLLASLERLKVSQV